MKVIKHVLSFTILFIVTNQAMAQDFTSYNHYSINPYTYNPAAVCQDYDLYSYVLTNSKQSGFENTPKYLGLGGYAALTDESAIGVKFNNYRGGSYNESEFSLSYGYKFQVVKDHWVALGLSAIALQRNLDLLDVYVFQTGDPTLESSYYRLSSVSFAVGLQYTFKDFEFQLSLPRILEINSVFREALISYMGYSYEVIPEKLSLTPSLLINHQAKGLTWIDLNLRGDIANKVNIQVTYRSNNNMIFLTNYNWNGIGIGYAYEMSVGPITNYSNGCHEIHLSYAMNKNKYRKETISF